MKKYLYLGVDKYSCENRVPVFFACIFFSFFLQLNDPFRFLFSLFTRLKPTQTIPRI